MISLLFFIMAAICDSVTNICLFHFNQSKFNSPKFNSIWWNAEISWRNKYQYGKTELGRRRFKSGLFIGKVIPVQITDAFHFFKMLKIIFYALSAVFAFYFKPVIQVNNSLVNGCLLLCIYGIAWNTIFSLFFDKILRK